MPEKTDNPLNVFEVKVRGILRTVAASRLWSRSDIDDFTTDLVRFVRDEVIPYYRKENIPLKPAFHFMDV